MSDFYVWGVTILVSYLLGSIPFGYLLALTQGKDVRTFGSGNIGATNVFRSIDKRLGILTFILDVAKGCIGVLLVPDLVSFIFGVTPVPAYLPLISGVFTVVGHNWTCFLGFRGGKGIAASAGMLLGLSPMAVGIAFLVWLLLFLLTRYVSIASIAAAVTLGILVWLPFVGLTEDGTVIPGVLTGLAVLAILKHHSNIRRLIAGTENRFTFKKGPENP